MAHRPLTVSLSVENDRGAPTPAVGGPQPTMSTETPRGQNSIGTDDRIAGPFTGYDRYGRPDHQYFECERCGAQAVRKRDLYGCC